MNSAFYWSNRPGSISGLFNDSGYGCSSGNKLVLNELRLPDWELNEISATQILFSLRAGGIFLWMLDIQTKELWPRTKMY